ncbi:hypothetical protein CNBF2970 [Cryptococcus deneoformans B-3501A]|uniref:Centrosomal protein ATPase n=1 Tax=Cryptococcus deneoformans (strain JEC21 / ATCC MYA-565) TaxID=214684 RepID=Q5KFH4_CRYD1|nr:hypothetical protein CNF01740 [Cryptococcus neoformans var. neoformans JEC21]XP_774617.1 hypothetical protein CNBF2970 [Cryptococcus neoformans var. neoformans B-3501A]AAW44001.1 hypothetical protein CNF01740 [Cryptococcus neoformans var. neoformans JEC21]EAL19970.1 hypothetical protein CNBF2970 [Cryptococcus neoformans var. neoformans B-3501A]
MSRYLPQQGTIPTIIPPQHAESKRDRKRRETVNKIEMLHDESWRTRDEKFGAMYKEYHAENKLVNSQPPTSAKYLLHAYPVSVERDARLEAAEEEYQYKVSQARKMYEQERESIEAQYWEARDQIRQRLLGAIEDRRKRLREEKEGGEIITESLLEADVRKPKRRSFFTTSTSTPRSTSPSGTNASSRDKSPSTARVNPADLMHHSQLTPTLALISTDDILSNDSSLHVRPAPAGSTTYVPTQAGKRGGPRGKAAEITGEGKELAAPGTSAALGIAAAQSNNRSRGVGGTRDQTLTLGRSLAELAKMTQAAQLEVDGDWARMQGNQGRGRRARGD